jgi:uronate dehydrogenase
MKAPPPSRIDMSKTKVLLTGAAGRIGQTLLPLFRELYELRTCDRVAVPGDPNATICDLGDRGAITHAAAGVDVVVHLASDARPAATIDDLAPPNIFGVHNVYAAAKAGGARRVVFASTANTVMAYPRDATVRTADPCRPLNVYGASKAFGELIARFYFDVHGLESVCIRLGAFEPRERLRARKTPPSDHWLRSLWLSDRDTVSVFRAAIGTSDFGGFAVVHATSRLEREYLSLFEAKDKLGWEPQDCLQDFFE